MVVRPLWKRSVCALAVVGCATAVGVNGPRSTFHAPARGPKTIPAAMGASGAGEADRRIAVRFEAVRADNQDLEYDELLKRLDVARPPDARPSFDPTRVAYYDAIRKALVLTAEEQEIYKRTGFVGVDHSQRYSMASAYLAIYRRDLPVLITADSILHAMHRSFDNILIELETGIFAPAIGKLLAETQARLRAEKDQLQDTGLRESAADVDLYLTVARNLIVGSNIVQGCPPDDGNGDDDCNRLESEPDGLGATSDFGQDEKVKEVLQAIAGEQQSDRVSLYGRRGVLIDWSQFRPRGHYTKSQTLRRYFRAMMWLGRVDLGFNLGTPDGAFGHVNASRELRDAVLLSWLVRQAGQLETLAATDRAIGFLIGLSDNTTAADVVAAALEAGVQRTADLAKPELLSEVSRSLGGTGQRIRSQLGARTPGGGPEVSLPDVFQLFGQRFVIDSFVTSKVVFDSILFKGNREERSMPRGLDVMAALGNDEAVGLAEPDLRQFHYGANLLAARRVIEERAPAAWNATQYDLWLSALSKLDDIPAGTDFPEVMRTQAWARKQLQTQLGSWAELRHDTILYAKQSYTMGIICDYPTGYVEPYPEFFARIATFAELADQRLASLKVPNATYLASFLTTFASIVRKLEKLAQKELAAQPFDADEKKFIQDTIKIEEHHSGGGCGGPTTEIIYTGWYPKLIYNGKPEEWEPTIADVHTSDGGVLEAAVGDVNFLVTAIDNRGDRAAYVGPVYSYYEFVSPKRLTDEEWRAQIRDEHLPPRPDWVRAFQARPVQRAMTPVKK